MGGLCGNPQSRLVRKLSLLLNVIRAPIHIEDRVSSSVSLGTDEPVGLTHASQCAPVSSHAGARRQDGPSERDYPIPILIKSELRLTWEPKGLVHIIHEIPEALYIEWFYQAIVASSC